MNNASKICISVSAASIDELEEQVRRADAFRPGWIEIRFDRLPAEDAKAAASRIAELNVDSKLIATFRPQDEGGYRQISEAERSDFWHSLPTRFEMCDIEVVRPVPAHKCASQIASRHYFDGPPIDLKEAVASIDALGTEVVKLAIAADDAIDAFPLWNELEQRRADGRKFIPVAMGDAGKWTRILGPANGAFLTYGALDPAFATGPGQITADDLMNVYRVDAIDRETTIFGVIGDPISQSLSPYIQNPLLQAADLNAVFIPFLVKDVGEFIRRMVDPRTSEAGLRFGGLSVTMPHKRTIREFLTREDASAAAAGAVNTVKVEADGSLTGSNTDVAGFVAPLKAKFGDQSNARVAVLGTGGAARACAYGSLSNGASVVAFAREASKASGFARDLDVEVREYDFGKDGNLVFHDFDILVNATPFGMAGELEDLSPITRSQFGDVRHVFDVVTKVGDTPLVAIARDAGLGINVGFEMLIAQGAEQFRYWTGLEADETLMIRSALSKMRAE